MAASAQAIDRIAAAPAMALLDDAAELARFTRWLPARDGQRTGESSLRIGGMHCAACAGLIEAALRRVDGVVDARVSAAAQSATVQWDATRTRPSALVRAIEQAGYSALPDTAAGARALRLKESRAAVWRLFVAAFCAMQVMMLATPSYISGPGELAPDLKQLLDWGSWLLALPVLLFAAAPFFTGAWRSVRVGRIGMDVPVALGIGVAFLASSGAAFAPGGLFGTEVYFDSLTMFVSFLLGGRYLEMRARHRAAVALEDSVGRLPETAWRECADGSVEAVSVLRLQRGDTVRVAAGQAFAADGVLLRGATRVDESLLSGESVPVDKGVGAALAAGSMNLDAPVVMRVERVGADTRFEAIVALMREARTQRPAMLRSADRWAAPFLWSVLLLAAGAAAVWSVIDPSRAVWVAVSVLIVTCPCALSLAAPSALLAAAGALVRRGVLVQRFEALEALASLDTICFDKTGTLTEPGPEAIVVALQPAAARAGLDDAGVRALAGMLGAASTHPLSASLAAHAPAASAPLTLVAVEEHPGLGVEAVASDGRRYRLGAFAWIAENASCAACTGSREDSGPETWLGGPDGALARFRFAEVLRHDARESVDLLRASGLAIELLSGDASARVEAVARELGVARARGDARPADKLAAVATLQAEGHRVAMVGDGLNDAPVMARADVSFAIGEGPALTRSHADFVLLSGSLADVAAARAIARRAMRVVRQNLAWAIAYNAVCVPVALLGWFPPWAAGLGMATSSLVVIVNALRIDHGAGALSLAKASTP